MLQNLAYNSKSVHQVHINAYSSATNTYWCDGQEPTSFRCIGGQENFFPPPDVQQGTVKQFRQTFQETISSTKHFWIFFLDQTDNSPVFYQLPRLRIIMMSWDKVHQDKMNMKSGSNPSFFPKHANWSCSQARWDGMLSLSLSHHSGTNHSQASERSRVCGRVQSFGIVNKLSSQKLRSLNSSTDFQS